MLLESATVVHGSLSVIPDRDGHFREFIVETAFLGPSWEKASLPYRGRYLILRQEGLQYVSSVNGRWYPGRRCRVQTSHCLPSENHLDLTSSCVHMSKKRALSLYNQEGLSRS